MTTTIPPQVGREYRTRDGGRVRITDNYGKEPYPVRGERFGDGAWYGGWTWTRDGHFHADRSKDPLDIIAEWPDAPASTPPAESLIARLDALERRLAAIERRVESLEANVSDHERSIGRMDERRTVPVSNPKPMSDDRSGAAEDGKAAEDDRLHESQAVVGEPIPTTLAPPRESPPFVFPTDAALTDAEVLAGIEEPTRDEFSVAWNGSLHHSHWLHRACVYGETPKIVATLLRERRARLAAEEQLKQRSGT